MFQFSQPTFSSVALTPDLINLFTPEFHEQERGENSEAYSDPGLYEGDSQSVGHSLKRSHACPHTYSQF